MSKRPVQVLAPAGGWEQLKAAVFAGADEVYLGGQAFGARASAKNFSREELAEAAAFCRARGVRLHVTVNTLLKDGELADALDFVEFLCSLPVDAVLVQDMGLFRLLRERAPGLSLHASTQMSLHTPGGVKLLYQLGATRAVLARELTLEEIAQIGESCPVQLESFVHGALCMCVSGQCYLSAALGDSKAPGRSGNRGQCAQPCRLPFAAPGGTGHDLSLKDLSFIGEMDRLAGAGVCSAKIEGRMKRPEYVAAATAACRLAADGQPVPEKLCQSLEAVFSRSGFTNGYLTGRRGRGMFGTRRKEDVTAATEKVLAELRGLYRGEGQRILVDLRLGFTPEGLQLTASDREGHSAAILRQTDSDTPKPLLPVDRCRVQLGKTGGTPFAPGEVLVPEEGAPLAVAELNALRRQALEALLERRSQAEPVPWKDLPLDLPGRPRKPQERPPVRGVFRHVGQLCPQARLCGEIALPVETPVPQLEKLRAEGWPSLLLELPRALFGREDRVRALMKERMTMGFDAFLCGNLGALALCRELGARAHGSFSLNITNTAAVETFAGLGLRTAEASFELSGRELRGLGGSIPIGVMAYGRQPLMLTRNCPLANSPKGCLNCRTPGCLTDRKGVKFPVVCRERGGFGSELLNSVPLWLGGMDTGADYLVFRFTTESAAECGRVLEAFERGEGLDRPYTRGLFRRGVE